MDALLYVEVEVDGATFLFGAADRATARLMGDTRELVEIRARTKRKELGRALTDEERQELAVIEEADLPGNMYESLCEIFVEGVRGWNGVRDLAKPNGDGGYEPLPCTPETIREFPAQQKVVVVSAYQKRRQQLELGKASPAEPATS